MIDKILPRKLSSSTDARVQGKDDMMDALNITVNDIFDSVSGTNTGDAGVIKPAKGNERTVVFPDTFDPQQVFARRVIGSVSDTRNNIVYFFLFSENASEHGVYCVDQFGKLFPSKDEEGNFYFNRVYSTSEFSFDSQSHVKGNIIHTSENEEGILYFTDNINEPRKLNVKRCVQEDFPPENTPDILDFITACPKTPIVPPIALFGYEPTKPSNDFANLEGYQFAYQCLYKDGEESAISTYSTLEYPPAYATQGKLKSPQLSFYNKCSITVRKFLNDVPAWTSEISKIRLLGRIGNQGDFKAIDEKDVDGDNDIVFDFFNDEVITAIPKEDELKQFDNLPRIAKAQTVVNNRLMYGNYVEGFDDVGDVSDSTTIQAIYNPFIGGQEAEDIEISIQPFMAPVAPENALFPTTPELVPLQSAGENGVLMNKRPAYVLNFNNLPDEVLPNSTLTVSFTIRPDRRYDFYKANNSFHTTPSMGLVPYAPSVVTNSNTKLFEGNPHHFQNNDGLSRVIGSPGDSVTWNTIYDVPNTGGSHANENVQVAYGTSPSNALSVPANDDLTFTVTLRYLEQISGSGVIAELTAKAFAAAVSGEPIPDDIPITTFEGEDFDIIETTAWDHGLGDIVFINIEDDRFQFINTLARRDQIASAEIAQPCGFFILNKGSISFKLNQRPELPSGNGKAIVELDLFNVSVDEEDIHTCVPDFGFAYDFTDFTGINESLPDGSIIQNEFSFQFKAYKPSFIEGPEFQDHPNGLSSINPSPETVFSRLNSNNQTTQNSGASGDTYYKLNECIYLGNDFAIAQPQLAYVLLGQETDVFGNTTDEYGTQLSFQGNTLSGPSLDRLRNIGVFKLNGRPLIDFDDPQGSFYSLCDGEVNAQKGGSLDGFTPIQSLQYNYETEAPVAGNPDEYYLDYNVSLSGTTLIGGYNRLSFIFGCVYGCDFFASSSFFNQPDYPMVVGPDSGFGFNQQNFVIPVPPSESITETATENSYAEIELKGDAVVNYNPGEELSRYSSFKTNANHDFGIVYYDERGRSGFVNKLGKVYVEGYSSQERGAGDVQGPVSIRITLDHDPPPWAHHYQIVYAKNSSVSDFVFYSTGTAYIAQNQTAAADGSIYVSLNYLQENSDVSYAEAFGGVAKDGTKDFYKFKEGDRLRVHSYFDDVDANTRVYPKDVEFEVLGVELLTDDATNPLDPSPAEGDVHEVYQGLYVKLKDNPSSLASGFNFESVQENQALQGNNEYDSTSGPYGNRWRKLCIVELFSPTRKQDTEERVFYETSRVFNIVTLPSGERVHEDTEIILTDGDVYFRKVAVNQNGVEGNEGYQYGLIEQEGSTVLSTPNFRNVFLESETFTDMFSGTDVYSFGKLKTLAPNAKEIRRDSSIKYSDKNSQSSSLLRYTSFNDTKFPFKDLPNDNGSIQVLFDYDDSVFCIQDDKTCVIPVERSILSDVSGTENLIGSIQVLGAERFFAGAYGTDHPESAVIADNNIYFASETNYEVYRFNPTNGLNVISDMNMKSFFKDLFVSVREQVNVSDKFDSVRVVGGYDPEAEEYLITVKPIEALSLTPIVVVDPDDGSDDDDGGDDTGGNTVPLVPIFLTLDYNEDGEIGTPDLLTFLGSFGVEEPPILPSYQFNEQEGEYIQTFGTFDTDGDGIVGTPDLLEILGQFGGPVGEDFVQVQPNGDIYRAIGPSGAYLINGEPVFWDTENQIAVFEDGTPVESTSDSETDESGDSEL